MCSLVVIKCCTMLGGNFLVSKQAQNIFFRVFQNVRVFKDTYWDIEFCFMQFITEPDTSKRYKLGRFSWSIF